MVETRTSRLTLVQWSSGSDSPSRTDFGDSFLSLETNAAQYVQGLRVDRPAPGVPGRTFTATDTKAIYYDDGIAWSVVGALIEDAKATSTTAGSVPLTVQGFPGQTADLTQWKDSAGDLLTAIGKSGDIRSPSIAARHSFGSSPIADTGVHVQAPAGGVGERVRRTSGNANVFQVEDADGTIFFAVDAAGRIIARRGVAAGVITAMFDSHIEPFGSYDSTSSTSYVSGTTPATLTFIAPASGRVLLNLASRIVGHGSGWGYMSYEIRNTNVGGAIWQGAHDARAVKCGLGKPAGDFDNSITEVVNGLTPGNQYFVRTMIRASSSGPGPAIEFVSRKLALILLT